MDSKIVIAVLLGLVASSFALDLSHADSKSLDSEARVFGLLNDFYATVLYKPLNHIVTNMALLGAQMLAGLADTGLPTPGGRSLHPSEAQLRGIFDDLWTNAVKPHLESALSGFSLVAAQLLANFANSGPGLGKRDLSEAEMRGFLDALSDAFNHVFTNVIQKPMEEAMSGGALMLAQVLAGIAANGVNLGKRDLSEAEMRGFLDALSEAFNHVFTNVIQKPMEEAMSGGALMLAQVLAGIGANGVNLGKRDVNDLAARQAELRGFFDTLGQGLLTGLQATWNNIIKDPMIEAMQTTSLLAAQVLAGIGATGVSLGKRSDDARASIFTDLAGHMNNLMNNQLKPFAETIINNALLQLAGALANFSQSQLGRR